MAPGTSTFASLVEFPWAWITQHSCSIVRTSSSLPRSPEPGGDLSHRRHVAKRRRAECLVQFWRDVFVGEPHSQPVDLATLYGEPVRRSAGTGDRGSK